LPTIYHYFELTIATQNNIKEEIETIFSYYI